MSSSGKILNKFREFIKSNFYENKVLETRKRLNIPENGYDIIDGIDLANESIEQQTLPFAYKILEEFPVQNHYLARLVSSHILYNQVLYDKIKPFNEENELCIVNSAKEQLQWLIHTSEVFLAEHVSKDILEQYHDSLIAGSVMYPTIIRMHEYATINDLKKLVKNSEKLRILLSENMSQEHKYSLKGAKTVSRTKITRRDDFINANLDLPSKELLRKLRAELNDESLDQGSIGKIKSRQRKLRDKM